MPLVEVRPLPIKRWHGKSGKDSFAMTKVIEVLYDNKTGKYATGLTEEETKKYSGLLGVDLTDSFNPAEAHPYWSSKAAFIKLENHTMIFDTDKPTEAVKIKNLKASKFVANSMKEYEKGEFPEATHVIFDENEEVSLKAGKVQKRQKAMVIASELSADEKISLVQILSNKTLKGRSNDFIDVEIDHIIETKADEFLKFAKMDKAEVNIRAQVLEGIAKNILTKEAGSIYYMGEVIGMDYEDAVDWFKNPQNQKMKVAILEKLTK